MLDDIATYGNYELVLAIIEFPFFYLVEFVLIR
jgi:hypothetical protein